MKTSRTLVSCAVAVALGAFASNAVPGGFAIGTQSGSGTGNAFAGGAAAADDASVAWYNPAAMMALTSPTQAAAALHMLKPSFKFTNNGSTGVFAAPGTGDGGDGGSWAFVPNAFFTMAINPQWSFGLAVNAPFGLKTEYDAGWRGQLTALKSEVKSANINPSVAFKVNEMVSLGAGVSVQKLEAKLTNAANVAGTNIANLNADDVGYGFNLGIMFQPAPGTRIGAAYRSAIDYDLSGSATFSATPAGNVNVSADLKVPGSFSLSAFHALNPQWELMGDITWTDWSTLQQLVVMRTSGAAAGTVLTTLPFQWDDTWRFSVGANYRMNQEMKFRFGLAYDQTPTKDATRTPRLPDQDRTWLAVGLQYKPSKEGTLEFGYAHEFIRDATINTSAAPLTCPANCLNGKFNNKADIISVQYSHAF